ncbi:MAG TPA: dTDP-4-amino-4,6-dideoxygalactose transaminase [Acetobacteraceae bacterium]
MTPIRFNVPSLVAGEKAALAEVLGSGRLAGNGPSTQACQELLQAHLGAPRVLITHSCTAALEMATILAGLQPGDEVIMPSFTFASTANPVVLRGAVPVFVDIRPDTLNIDETLIEAAITPRTRAICVVHYAGVGAAMDAIGEIAMRHELIVIEDAAQALHASYRGRPLGTFGQLAGFSFHETKNLISGEGGALIVNDPALSLRAEIIWEKGTNRAQFMRGEVSRYTWVDVGSSFLPSEIIAAVLREQLVQGEAITARRRAIWQCYHEGFAPIEASGAARRPVVPVECEANGHTYFLLVSPPRERDEVVEALRARGIPAAMHYVPLHSAPAGLRFGRCGSDMAVTDALPARLLRLPLHLQLSPDQQDRVISEVNAVLA